MMSAPRRPARAGFGIARDSATKIPAATSLRIVDLGRVSIRPVFDLSFTSCSFQMGQLELLVYGFVSRVAWPTRSDRKSTRLNSSHTVISYAVFCLKKKKY